MKDKRIQCTQKLFISWSILHHLTKLCCYCNAFWPLQWDSSGSSFLSKWHDFSLATSSPNQLGRSATSTSLGSKNWVLFKFRNIKQLTKSSTFCQQFRLFSDWFRFLAEKCRFLFLIYLYNKIIERWPLLVLQENDKVLTITNFDYL